MPGTPSRRSKSVRSNPASRSAPLERGAGRLVLQRPASVARPLKWVDTNLYNVATTAGVSIGNTTSITTTGTHYSVAAIPAGTDRINRIGRQIRLRGIELRALVEAAKENLLFAGDYNNVVRVVLWRTRSLDPLTSGSSLTSNLFPVGDAITAHLDLDDVAEIYFDKTVTVRTTYGPNSTGTGTATQTQWQALIHEVVSLDLPVTYSNTGAANVADNQVILSWWSDSSIAPNPTASASLRVHFEDVQV